MNKNCSSKYHIGKKLPGVATVPYFCYNQTPTTRKKKELTLSSISYLTVDIIDGLKKMAL